MRAAEVPASKHPPRAVLEVFCPVCASPLSPGPLRWVCRECDHGWSPEQVQESVLDASAELLRLLAGLR